MSNYVEVWSLQEINGQMLSEFTDKPSNYVSSEMTSFVERYVDNVKFFKISPKKTVCLITMKNGFDVIGYSGCINPMHYRKDIGSKYALHTAVDKASEIIAYQEQNNLFNSLETQYDKPE